MNLEEAITTALEYEARVHKVYREALEDAETEVARRVFSTLCQEEQGHIKYLRDRLEEWRSTGEVSVEELDTVLVPRMAIEDGVARLRNRLAEKGRKGSAGELEHLRKALEVENQTSAFYREMVGTLTSADRSLFERFAEIEEGHVAIVQAEIDCISGTGFWFDTAEFSLEKG